MEEFLGFLVTAANNIWTYGVTFIVVLSILVFIHEFGHYFIARLCGVRVETFSIGFGPELWGRTDKHGTHWKVCLVPLGGYVKMFGDTDAASGGHAEGVEIGDHVRPFTDEEKKVTFFNKSVAQRSAIVFAGPGINFLFAIVILACLYASFGKPVTPPVIAAVEVESAADNAGLKPNDKVLSINSKHIESFDDIRRTVMLALDAPLKIEVERDGKVQVITARPARKESEDRFGFKHERGHLGVLGPTNGFDVTSIEAINEKPYETLSEKQDALANMMGRVGTITLKKENDTLTHVRIMPAADLNKELLAKQGEAANVLALSPVSLMTVIELSPIHATTEAVKKTWQIMVDTLGAIWQIITGERSTNELGGLIRIGAFAGDMAQQGLIALISFTALLSINLGLINLFPIPMLDGGHLVFYAAELVRGKPIPERVQEYAFRVGFVMLITLIVFSNLNDVLQLIF
ncbi:MAG: RIP metalloprotease RseP [Alphaproteobacteria bacterium]|nr:RIP metalloprotease RseP [Alphaproteobacteria bacterium]